MRRATLITIIVLFALLLVAAIFQGVLAHGPRRYPGPGVSPSPTVSKTGPSPSAAS